MRQGLGGLDKQLAGAFVVQDDTAALGSKTRRPSTRTFAGAPEVGKQQAGRQAHRGLQLKLAGRSQCLRKAWTTNGQRARHHRGEKPQAWTSASAPGLSHCVGCAFGVVPHTQTRTRRTSGRTGDSGWPREPCNASSRGLPCPVQPW